ncbi:SspB family protein [Brucella sp. IR073]|uniref:SspB family protein n=1 Tax=unclassified Brucella TaxID=2632610 RepID=UPI003B9860CB
MVQDLIRYDILAQEALRGVIRKVLSEVAKAGLPGNHHFFITFLTEAPGVRISSRLKEKYPEQMTIVLQHQFWDLQVTDQHFEVGLSFGDVPERLVIPFSAVRGFYDPSVNFELEFDVSAMEPAGDNDSNVALAAIERVEERQEKPKPKAKPAAKTPKKAAAKADDEAKKDEAKPMADVVSLDAFRKNK